jgi:predicted permease
MALFSNAFGPSLAQALRRLAKAPLFTTVTLLTLAIAIGASAAIFGVVNGIVLKPLPYPHPDRLIGLREAAPGVNLPDLNMAEFLYFTFREQNHTFEDIGAYNGDGVSVTGTGRPEHVEGLDVSDGTLPLLGATPLLGRLFTRHDDSPGAAKTVVLSYGYWQRRFGGSRSVLGQNLTIDGAPREIIGVLPRGFQFLDDDKAELYLPYQWDRSKVQLGSFNFDVLARLKPGVTMEQASADVARMIPIAIRSFPPPQGFSRETFEKAQFLPALRTLEKTEIGDVGNVLWVLMGSILVVLLVACANVANLLLVRAEGRRQELAIRSALGASRGGIALELMMESAALSASGGLAGLGLAYGALRALLAIAPAGLPRLHEIGIDLPVLLFTLGLVVFVSLVIGIIPALQYSGVRAHTGLRENGRTLSQSRERHRARKALVVVQVALALVLTICTGLMIRTFHTLVRIEPGFTDPAALETFSIDIPPTQVPETENRRVLLMEQQMDEKLAAIPGVSSVGITTMVPMSGNYSFNPVYAEDHSYRAGELPPMRRYNFISPGFFAALGTPMIAGRDFTWAEEFEKQPEAIVSQNFAREYWGSAANALGKHIREATTDGWCEIVGVAGDIYADGVDKPAPTAVYWPLYQNSFYGHKEVVDRDVNFVVRSPDAGSSAFVKQMQRAVWSVDPELPLAMTTTLGTLYTKSMARTSFTLVLLSVAGGMALLLGILGIYGVVSYAVSQRTHEIGIRMALGAQRENLTALFVRQGLVLAGLGVACGLATAAGTARLMAALLFGVSPVDAWTYSGASILVLAIAAMACYLPSRRAAAVDPVCALRAE